MKVKRILLLAAALLTLCSVAAAKVDPYAFEPPVTKGYSMPYTLTVYLSRQMVVAYDAATGQPARYMICSSGLYNPTPRFDLTIPGYVIQPWAKWGNVYVRYPTKIKGSYYFHSITYNSRNSVNQLAWQKLGQRASHGCVRLTPLDAQWVAYNCKKGTRVRVVDSDDSGLGLAQIHNDIRQYLNKNGLAAVQPTLSPTPTPLPQDISVNSTNVKSIKALQNKLRSRGFLNSKSSGVFDANTVNAWNEYQTSQGWEPDGVATTQEQVFLTNDETTIAFNRDLKLGDTGIIVLFVEQRLKSLGYFAGNPSMGYDSVTVAAVKKYQKAVGIVPANGKLLSSQQPNLFVGGGAIPTPTPDPGLTIGNSGSKVKKLQNRLYTLGFFNAAINGVYNAATQSSVKAFQTAAGLGITGNADEETYNLIISKDDYIGTARTLSVGSKGIVVSAVERALQKLTLFSGVPDTLYDKNTFSGVKAFQQSVGIKQTGVANPETLIKLFAA